MSTKQNITDPTYLRTIHDGLLSGAIHKDNASTLPIGLIGIYEEALPPDSNVNERRKFLEFFAVWALLKKEVSAAFVVPLLEGWTEEHVLDYISKYSKWFNSPVIGKYVLYHERIRSFIIARITDVNSRNDNLVKILLIKDKKKDEVQNETTQYLQEYHGDHLAISAYYKNDDLDEYYIKLKEIDKVIAHLNWIVKDLDRLRWNELSGILAAIDGDVDFLKELVLSQDRILNKEIDFEGLLQKITRGEFDDLDDILINSEDSVYKHLVLFALIFRLIQFSKTEQVSDASFALCLNDIIKRLNELNSESFWIIPLEVVEQINIDLNRIKTLFEVDVDSINNTKYDTFICKKKQDEFISKFGTGKRLGELPSIIIGNLTLSELYVKISDIEQILLEEDISLKIKIRKVLINFINEDLSPLYKGNLKRLQRIIDKINDYQFLDIENKEDLFDIFISIKEAVGYTGSSDFNNDYNDLVLEVLPIILKFNSNTPWVSCFCDSVKWIDTVNYYKVICEAISNSNLRYEYIQSFGWNNKDNFLAVSIAISTIYFHKGQLETGLCFYQKAIDDYLNFSLTHESNIHYCRYILKKEFTETDYDLLLLAYKNYEFRHIPTISYYLCKRYSILEIINMLNDDKTYYSGVENNNILLNEILKGVISALGIGYAKKYVLCGLSEYTSVMGKFHAYDYDQEDNRPEDNIWKIEWWVMGNVIYCFHQLADQLHCESWSDFASDEYGSEITFFDEDSFYSEIEEIFMKYGYNPEDNLYISIDDYKDIMGLTVKEDTADIFYEYYLNPLKTLIKFSKKSKNTIYINSLASMIRSEYSA